MTTIRIAELNNEVGIGVYLKSMREPRVSFFEGKLGHEECPGFEDAPVGDDLLQFLRESTGFGPRPVPEHIRIATERRFATTGQIRVD